MQRAGTRFRVSVQLIDARNDAHVWAERYDRELADVFAIESELAEQIVSKLKARLGPDEKAAIEERPTRDLVAYELYARAKEIMDAIFLRPQSKEDLLEAVQLLDQATGRDGSFLVAYCQLTRAHDMLYS